MDGVSEVTITIPLGESESTSGFRIDVDLGVHKGRAFNRVRVALDEQGARLSHGRRIQSNADVVRWLSEEIDRAIEAKVLPNGEEDHKRS